MPLTEPMTGIDYKDFVAERFAAALSGEPVVFTNRGNTHAVVVLGHLIASAQSSLDLYTGCLAASVYHRDELRAKSRALGKGKTRVVIGDPFPFAEVSVLDYLQSEIEDGFILPRMGNIKPERISELNHFAMADGNNLRVENNHTEKTAVVMLNADKINLPDSSKSLALSYRGLFENLFQQASAYAPRVAA